MSSFGTVEGETGSRLKLVAGVQVGLISCGTANLMGCVGGLEILQYWRFAGDATTLGRLQIVTDEVRAELGWD